MPSPRLEQEEPQRKTSGGKKYNSMFKRWKTKKPGPPSPLQCAQEATEARYLADNASLLPRPSDVTCATQSSRFQTRRDIQSHIPDWIDDVVHAQLVEIAERLAAQASSPDAEDPWSPSLPDDAEEAHSGEHRVSEEQRVSEEGRPGSAPLATGHESDEDERPRRSSVSAPSTRSLFLFPGARSLISPIESLERPSMQILGAEQTARHSRNLSSSSGSSRRSEGTATSVYSKRSSQTSPGTSLENRISDQLSNRMTWRDIATRTGPIKKPVQAGLLKKVNTHAAQASTTYSIMSPVSAGVFDEVRLHVSKPSTRYTILSPVTAGVFDDADVNKPLPPDPRQRTKDKRTTFFVVGEAVHTPHSVGTPPSTHIAETLHTPLSAPIDKSLRSPSITFSPTSKPTEETAQSPMTEMPPTSSTTLSPSTSFAAKKFARLSRPFIEPIFDCEFPDALPSIDESEYDEVCISPDLTEKIVVVLEEEAGEVVNVRDVSPAPSRTVDDVVANESNAEVGFQAIQHDSPVSAQIVETTQNSPVAEERSSTPVVAQQAEQVVAADEATPYRNDRETHGDERDVLSPTPPFPADQAEPIDKQPVEEAEARRAEEEEAEARRAEEEEAEVQRADEDEEEEDLDDNASVTLSQAEDELMAQLSLDTSQKFRRPASWLADSPTLGSPPFGRPPVPVLRVDSAQEGTTPVEEDVPIKKKTQSHYEFLWSPDGWYVA